jgi:cardiolipin synthase
MRLITLIFCIFLLIPVVSALALVEFCPDPYLPEDPDEYVVLEGNGTLEGVTVSDGEGGFRFPPGTEIRGRLTIARNGDAYRLSHGEYPDYEWYDTLPEVPDVIRGGTLRLGNANDNLQLFVDGHLQQEVAWPQDVKPREGQVHFFEDGTWDPRVLLIGQSAFDTQTYENVSGIAFVSPDCSSDVYEEVIDESSERLLVNVYEFTHPGMADAFIRAHDRGVSVTILLEGGPVGGISPEEKTICWKMNQSGIPVYQMTTLDGVHAPYRYNHAKYIVADTRGLLITSENFKESGFPESGEGGNRGWGVYLESVPVAEYFTRVFEYDTGGGWIAPLPGMSGTAEESYHENRQVVFRPERFSGAEVTPVLSPDTSGLVLRLVESAEKTIDIEEAYISNTSNQEVNPYLGAAINASRRGVNVRVLLDSYWFNVENEDDNDEMVRYINHIAQVEKLPLEARCAGLDAAGLEKIHNKGVIVDGEQVLISSINWNTNSPTFNREAGVIIAHSGVARYFGRVFEADWNASSGSGSAENPVDYLKIGLTIGAVLLLILFFVYRRTR